MKDLSTRYSGDEYEAIATVLDERKHVYGIREWVEMQDLYVDEAGNVFYVELYNTTYSREEGHGFHDVIDSQEPHAYIPFMTADEVVLTTAKFVAQCEEKPLPWYVWLGLGAVLFSVFIIVLNPSVLAWVDTFAK